MVSKPEMSRTLRRRNKRKIVLKAKEAKVHPSWLEQARGKSYALVGAAVGCLKVLVLWEDPQLGFDRSQGPSIKRESF